MPIVLDTCNLGVRDLRDQSKHGVRFKSQRDMDRGESKDQIIDTVSALALDPIWFFFQNCI